LSKYGDIFIFLPKKVFRTIGSELFLNHHSTKLRQKKKKKKKTKKTVRPGPSFFFPNLQVAKFCQTKNNPASRAAKERRRRRRGRRVRRFFCVLVREFYLLTFLLNPIGILQGRGSVVRVKEIKQAGVL
jgi:hypothetical protein